MIAVEEPLEKTIESKRETDREREEYPSWNHNEVLSGHKRERERARGRLDAGQLDVNYHLEVRTSANNEEDGRNRW